jgi:hypothetical protein
MSKGGGQKSTGTQTVKNEPASFVAPYYTEAAGQASNLYNNYRPEFFGGSAFTPYSPETEVALQAQTQRAMSGNPALNAAQEQQYATIRGDYLSGSPQLQQELDKVSGRVNSQFAQGGGYRSSANQEVLGREMGDAVVRNYANERNMQQQSAIASPSLAAADYADISALSEVGVKREDLFSRQLQDQMNRFYFDQEQDPAALDEYIRRVTQLGNGFGTQQSTGTQPSVGRSVIGGAMSGAQAGAGLAGALSLSNPWTMGLAGAGAVLGGLFK